MEIKDLFVVRATNEENNNYIVTIGKHLATEKMFKTKEEALEYIDRREWDAIGSLISEMIEANKEVEQIRNSKENK